MYYSRSNLMGIVAGAAIAFMATVGAEAVNARTSNAEVSAAVSASKALSQEARQFYVNNNFKPLWVGKKNRKRASALLEAVFRRSNTLLSGSVVELYRYAETPYERLWAIIVANFFETIFNRQVCQAWVSLISEVPHNTECQRVQIANNERIRGNLMHELKHFLPEQEAEQVARHLGVHIDGIWVRAGLLPHPVETNMAISEMQFAIEKMLPLDEISATKHKEARKKIKAVADIALGSKAFKEKFLQV